MPAIKSVTIRCGHCQKQMPSPVFFGTTEAFESSFMMGNKMQCRHCGQMFHCNKENLAYVLADGSGGAVGEDFGGNKL